MTYDDLTQEIMVSVPGVIKATARKAVIAAARKLCKEANVIKIDETLTLLAAEETAAIAVTDAGLKLEPVRIVFFDKLRKRQYVQETETRVRFAGANIANMDYTYKLACRPAEDSTDLHSDLEHWSETIQSYALYKMMIMPGKDWSNPNLAQHHRKLWTEGLSSAKQSAALGFNTGSARVRAPKFF